MIFSNGGVPDLGLKRPRTLQSRRWDLPGAACGAMGKALVPSDGCGRRWGGHMCRTKLRRQRGRIGRLRLGFDHLLMLGIFSRCGLRTLFFILKASHLSFPIFFIAFMASDGR